MADKKITQLPSASIATSSDVLPIVQDSTTEQITVSNLGQGILNLGLDATFSDVQITSSFTASLQENYIWLGDSNDTSEPVPVSTLTSIFPLNYGLFNQTGSSTPISASTSELSLIGGGVGTLTVPANAFRQGDAYHAILTGHGTFSNNDTLQIKVKSNGTTLVDSGVITLTGADNKDWKLEIFFSINKIGGTGVASITSGGTFMYSSDASDKYNGIIFSTINSSSFDTTTNNILNITGQFNTGDNIMYSEICTLNKTF
jgi:hypothetical protein